MHRETDEKLKEFFKAKAGRMEIPDGLKERIDKELVMAEKSKHRAGISERKSDMRFRKRKIILAAAAVMAIGSITCIAAGQLAGTVSSSSNLTEVREYSGLSEMEKKAGMETGLPEQFSNGYTFQYVNTGSGESVDADGEKIPGTEYTDIFAGYEKDGNEIAVYVMPDMGEEENFEGAPKASQTKEIGGIPVSFTEITMKLVPPDYELTEEDKKDMENPNFTISYGVDTVQIQTVRNLTWKMDDKRYDIVDTSGTIDADTMFSMAEELIGK